jgi:signal transduction histidine kinase
MQQGDVVGYYRLYHLSDSLESIVFNDKIVRNTQELEVQYQTKKKEQQLQLQHVSIRQKNIIALVLGGLLFAFAAIIFLGYRNSQQKRKLQQQRIVELETEKQLLATEAVLKGQDEERSRLAKDLHDGLGGMLSGIKFSFTTMKGNLVMTAENALAFERSMDMLDSSIKELRMVAHNLMPESLIKFGLDTALKDFCGSVSNSGIIQLSYHSFGMEEIQVEQTAEINLYRIIQELVNNILKHAAASEAIVQLQVSGNELQITVEDNGKGFDTGAINISNGMGWANIHSRVEYLKGNIVVQAAPGKGTSVNITIPVVAK